MREEGLESRILTDSQTCVAIATDEVQHQYKEEDESGKRER